MADPPDDRVSVVDDYSSPHGLPEHTRRFKQLIADTARLYEPDIVDGASYSLHSIVVPVPLGAGAPPIAFRMAGLRPHTDASVVRQWTADLQQTAHHAARQLTAAAEVGAHQ
jgi:hypothetical protein